MDIYRNHLIYRIKSRAVQRDNGCLEYGGGLLKHKYGLVGVNGKNLPAHRAMYMAINGMMTLPHDMFICHRCDNPCCVNIEHLFIGTPSENTRDMIDKGRKAKRHTIHKRLRMLDDATVQAIRNEPGTHKQVAAKYGISHSYVHKLKARTAKPLVE